MKKIFYAKEKYDVFGKEIVFVGDEKEDFKISDEIVVLFEDKRIEGTILGIEKKLILTNPPIEDKNIRIILRINATD